MNFLNCVSSLKTCSGCTNNKRNTILRYWHWIHFVIWSSVYTFWISQYSLLPNETVREKRNCGWVNLDEIYWRFLLNNVGKLYSLLYWSKPSMQPLYFKRASTFQRIAIWAPWKVHHLWRLLKCRLLNGYK